ncbi:MAG: SH3 domain-containing protein, partial [Candidatus Krumholzibacteriia bacterium]
RVAACPVVQHFKPALPAAFRRLGVVVAAEVEVRSGPQESFPVVFRVHDGLAVDLRGEQSGWQRISLGGEWVGWVPRSTVVAVRWP